MNGDLNSEEFGQMVIIIINCFILVMLKSSEVMQIVQKVYSQCSSEYPACLYS